MNQIVYWLSKSDDHVVSEKILGGGGGGGFKEG